MRILITVRALDQRDGSTLYTRDLALGLVRRGHTPIVYTTRKGEVADDLRSSTVAIVDDLERLSVAPDLIHGQHHLETMTALLAFPGVPAIHLCHGWLPWQEAPLRFPRILRHVAIDDACLDRLLMEHAIPADRARVLLNAVDLDRFRPRGPLPPRPGRALVFSNAASERSHLPAVRAVCARHGIALDVAGQASGRPASRPEEILPGYDLVFAKARAALEALAVGTAVVLCDAPGSGPLVTTENLDRLRRLNFGLRALREPLDPVVLAREVARYDPADAGEVGRRVRAGAGHEALLDEMLALYDEVLEEWKARPAAAAAEAGATAAYLRWLSCAVEESIREETRRRARHRSPVRRLRDQIRKLARLAGVPPR